MIEGFESDGFAALGERLPAETLDALAGLFTNAGPGARITDRVPEPIADALIWPPLAQALTEIDPTLRPVRILLFAKQATANWFVPWHQDAAVAIDGDAAAHGFINPTIKDEVQHWEAPAALLAHMVAVRLHIDDAGQENGPLEVVPGSHKEGFLSSGAITAATLRRPVRSCTASRGDIHLLRPLLVHRSRKALSPNRRRTVQIELAPADSLPAGLTWRLSEAGAAASQLRSSPDLMPGSARQLPISRRSSAYPRHAPRA